MKAVIRPMEPADAPGVDRKSTRLNSSHANISYAVFCFKDTATTEIYTLSLHDALPISLCPSGPAGMRRVSRSRGRSPEETLAVSVERAKAASEETPGVVA